MSAKNLKILFAAAAVLAVAAYFAGKGSKPSAPRLNGKPVAPGFNAADVARIEIGGKLAVASSGSGWTVETLYGYPASREKIAENLLKVAELKVGQVVRGRKPGETNVVAFKDADGREVATLVLGDRHAKKYPDGRYLAFEGETVLVKDTLDAFDGDPKKWCETRIASIPSSDVTAVSFRRGKETLELEKGTNSTWTAKGLAAGEELDVSKTYSLDSALSYLDFNGIADPALKDDELGFATGCVCTVAYKSGTNVLKRVATVGGVAKGGTDRYLRLDGEKWTYIVSSYAAENLSKSRGDLVKAKKAEEKKAEPKNKAEPAKKKAEPAKKKSGAK